MKKLTMNQTRGIVARIKKDVEGILRTKVNTEHSSTYITLKFMEDDNCSYKSITLEYQELFSKYNKLQAIDIMVENFIDYYSEDINTTIYKATGLELFINSLIEKNECENFYVDTNSIWYEGININLEDITRFQYFPTIDSLRLDTDTEYCIIELDRDVITCLDKDEVAE